MRAETRVERQAQIERAAYRLLRERGYGGTSMLAIAREARASNETLYRWYGDKNGLFKTMVESNAQETREALQRAIEAGVDPLECLENVAPVLLSMLLGEKAVLLNRAAAADESGELGRAISAGGRSAVAPLVEQLLRQACEDGSLDVLSPSTAAEQFFSLLIGDLQIRRVIGVLPEPQPEFVVERVSHAMMAFKTLCVRSCSD
ncbi:TetR/AcrR family transcriptional regulator [Nitratireductor kimnyeongensis]|uniref:TetR/AcrR family transcriptional regulator n=1 Tax=Nitratireductor kimnyeongensis TaxID=430679 RepID=A0ABW0T7Y8_9HYPH|nr:TetR/AcrR family transcriptional regulator [Nitratireductor kimnyeongensis]QZZ36072.1 TetR/AcrR family transcriptional regulator [Nitratireductor kimnyeongensis]